MHKFTVLSVVLLTLVTTISVSYYLGTHSTQTVERLHFFSHQGDQLQAEALLKALHTVDDPTPKSTAEFRRYAHLRLDAYLSDARDFEQKYRWTILSAPSRKETETYLRQHPGDLSP